MDAGMLDNWKGVCFLGTQMQTFWLWKTAAAEEEDLMISSLRFLYLCLFKSVVCYAHSDQFCTYQYTYTVDVWKPTAC